ncbi:hypothetical protein L218DRAFT_1008221 [Marasmius fiardii PR-910]|nr:hypothetical protein L218DRAFT_1008221 [Marasmius fiardii PR-910]
MSRGIIYASVAAADPAITEGLKVLWRHYIRRQVSNSSSNGLQGAPGDSPDFEMQQTHIRSEIEGRRGEAYIGESNNCVAVLESVALPVREAIRRGTTSLANMFVDASSSESERQVSDTTFQYPYAQLRQL